ncbi:MAG: sensor histidine kinase [Chromatiales bacterium]
MAAFPGHLSRKNEYRILSAMLFLLHLAVWWDFGSMTSRSLLLAHAGVFLIWQPFLRLEKRFGLKDTVLFSLVSIGLAYWLDRWLFFCWFLLLIGLMSGLPGYRRSGRLVYMPVLFFLVSDLLIGCVPHLFRVEALPPAVITMFQYGLLAVPAWVFIVRPDPGGGASSYSVDLLRAITASLITAMLAVGSIAITYHLGVDYPVALFHSLLGLALFLFIISWLLSPRMGFIGLAQLWERSLMNIGTPFEQWLSELAKLADQQQSPDQFFEVSINKLIRLPWFEGAAWVTKTASAEIGRVSEHSTTFRAGDVSVILYARRPMGPGLLLHCNLLVQVLVQFHLAKLRELELANRTHLQAIYETGARVAHDMKNLLQSLHTLTSALKLDDNDDEQAVSTQPRTTLILRRQLPLIIQRLQRALDKLQTPEKAGVTHVDVADWWHGATTRHGHNGVQFRATISTHTAIPADLFDSVIDNLLENAYVKRRAETGIGVTVTLQSEVGSLCLRVCDQGSAIAAARANELFKQPVLSYSGLGIGLYQAGKQAALSGYTLALSENKPGRVCFSLSAKATAWS